MSRRVANSTTLENEFDKKVLKRHVEFCEFWFRIVRRLYSLGPDVTLVQGFGSPDLVQNFTNFSVKIFSRSFFSLRLILPPGKSYCLEVLKPHKCIPFVSIYRFNYCWHIEKNLPFIPAILVRISIGNISSLPHQVLQILHGAEWQPKKSSVFRTTSTSPAQRSKGNLVYHHLQIWGWVTREFWTSQRYQVNASQARIRPGHPARRFPRSGSKGRVGPSGSQKGPC